jgi:UDP-4-amino-4,6-dideoxy-N-acetyl-beta-L-altrosamine transaminase
VIPYGRQDISDEDVAAVVAALRSDFITQGPAIRVFEASLAGYVGAAHAVAVCNATAALHIAYLALGLGPGDRLWTTPNTFVATANAARICGAEVDFVDIASDTYLMDVDGLAARLARARRQGRLPKIVAPVHFAGQSCDMRAIRALADDYSFKIVEDAAHAIGADYLDRKVGDCRFSDLAVFSFHPVKIITTGEGGVALTNDAELAHRMAMFRSHGITRDPARLERKGEGAYYYEQQMLGYNYRMIELEAALGLSQLTRLDEFVERRNQIARRYDSLLSGLPIVTPVVQQDRRSSFHLYVVRLPKREPVRHRKVFDAMRSAGVGVNLHYMPVHLQPDFRRLGFRPGMFEESESYGETALSLPMFPALTDRDQDHVVESLSKALENS